ncbi:MAG: hypothetical protein ABWX92_18125 [Mycetocola sp.]
MAVISPLRQSDSHDAEFTVEPDRGGEALIEEARQHARTRRRRTKIGAVVIAALLSVTWAAVLAFGFVGTPGTSEPGLGAPLAEGVRANPVPSAELVASFYTHWSAGKDQFIYVYDDGRVVFMQRGWQQRVLTTEGVELLRAEIIASGILGPSRYAEAHQFGSGAFVQLRIDGVLTAAWQPPRTADHEVDAFNRVINQLSNFDHWLPAEAWARPEMVAYVPSGYAVCVSGENTSFPSVHDAMLPHLPDDAAAALAAGPRFDAIDPQTDGYAGSNLSPSSDIVGCRHLTPAQAQSVVDTLVREGWGVEDSGPPSEGEQVVLTERERIDPFDMSTTIPGVGRLHVGFSAILPHGVPECACYG